MKSVDVTDSTLGVDIKDDDEEHRWGREELVVRATEIGSQ